jgi:hypothetical protein
MFFPPQDVLKAVKIRRVDGSGVDRSRDTQSSSFAHNLYCQRVLLTSVSEIVSNSVNSLQFHSVNTCGVWTQRRENS